MVIGADRFIDSVPESTAKLHATQRYRDGISEVDMWNLDCFISDVIVAGCQWHLDNGQGGPWHLDPDEWRLILVDIRDGFAKRDEFGAPMPSKSVWKLLRKNFRFFWD